MAAQKTPPAELGTQAAYAWVLNLDAELELASPRYQPTAKMTEQLVRYRELARGLLQPGDVLLPVTVDRAGGLLGRAWCPTPRALAAMRAARIAPEPHPAAAVLRQVNHRAFAHALGFGLPGQQLIHSMADLQAALTKGPQAWLLKRPLSFAGRGHWRVFGTLDVPGQRWVEASLREDVLLAEPLVRPLVEFSLHGFVLRDGTHTLGRVCVQSVSERGVYHGVRAAHDDDLSHVERRALLAATREAAAALARAGYFGPFGVDAYRFTGLEGSGEGFCAMSEINARYTMAFSTGFPLGAPPLG